MASFFPVTPAHIHSSKKPRPWSNWNLSSNRNGQETRIVHSNGVDSKDTNANAHTYTKPSPEGVVSEQRDQLPRMTALFGLVAPSENEDLQVPPLQVVGYLGHGASGLVEEVRTSPVHYQSFVRKRVHLPYNRKKECTELLRQEAATLRTVAHPHIVELLGVSSENGGPGRDHFSLFMAPVGEHDLRTFLSIITDPASTYPVAQKDTFKRWLWDWLICLSSALAFMHSKGVRHQDIKPVNIIHRGSVVYFTDFGSAGHFQPHYTTSTDTPARITYMYAAPEVFTEGSEPNRHGRGTDVFALGTVFTEMLAVIRGSDVEKYHDYLRGSLPAFFYAEVLEKVRSFFKDDDFFWEYLQLMLRPDRKERSDARSLARKLRKALPVRDGSCLCDRDL